MSPDRISMVARKAAKTVFAAADIFYGPFPGPRLLVYHQFDAGLGREMEVSTEAFVAHLDWLESNGEVVALGEALARRGEPNDDRLYVVTIDDGYRDFYTKAFPVLRERGFPFTLYLTTQPTETGRPLTPGGRADPLTWDQVNDMLQSGLMTLGAHTHTHPDLRQLSQRQIADELDSSNRLIEERTGVRPMHFAYPKGIWSQMAEPIINDRYQTAVLGAGEPLTPEINPLRLTRVPIQRSDGVWFFARKLRSGFRAEEKVRRSLRRYAAPPTVYRQQTGSR